MIVDLAHVPNLTQRRADAPLNPLSESPLTNDVVQLQMPDTAEPDASSTDDMAPQYPNHQPSDQLVLEHGDDEPQRIVTGTESEPDNEEAEAGETVDKTDSSRPKPSASHNLPKLVIPEPDDNSARRRR